MADKTLTAIVHDVIENTTVSTSGTIAAGSIKIIWDDADDKLTLCDMLEKATRQFHNYLLTSR